MDPITDLIEIFRKFPGIGPRQARRFAFFLIGETKEYREKLISSIQKAAGSVTNCNQCYRFFAKKGVSPSSICPICADPKRNSESLLVVSRDVDFENIEKSKVFDGKYFILGGTIPLLEEKPEEHIRLHEFLNYVEESTIKEIIFAMNLTSEGENTERALRAFLQPIAGKREIRLSSLGRGLSTGAELEYSDQETIAHAFKGRK